MADFHPVELAEIVGATVSEALLADMAKRAPKLAPVMHALGLAWAARVAIDGLEAAFKDENDEVALNAFRALYLQVLQKADVRVALKRLELSQRTEKPRG